MMQFKVLLYSFLAWPFCLMIKRRKKLIPVLCLIWCRSNMSFVRLFNVFHFVFMFLKSLNVYSPTTVKSILSSSRAIATITRTRRLEPRQRIIHVFMEPHVPSSVCDWAALSIPVPLAELLLTAAP